MSGQADPDVPRAIQVLGRVPLHPGLAALWPALALWASNVDEVLPAEVIPTLWQPLVAVAVVWAVIAALLRSVPRAAFVATMAAVVALNTGRITGHVPGPRSATIAGIAVLLTLGVAWGVPRAGVRPLTAVANVAAAVLVVLSLPPIVATWLRDDTALAAQRAQGRTGIAGRDIFYIVPDRYPRADTLESVFGYDNEPFIDFLEERGFQVAERSLANYPKTAHSLAATWNLATLDELIAEPPSDGGDWGPIYRLLRDHELGRILTEAGYRYDHLGTWWSPTSRAESADRNLRVDTATEFGTVWRSLTLLPYLTGGLDDGAEEGELSLRERNRRYSAYQLDELDRLARERSRQPRFILAHVTIPHEPYVFDADGSFVTQEVARERGREVNLVNQVEFLNARLRDLIEELTSGPEETWPVIVIQSDEGPHPRARTGADYDWTTAPDEVLAEKLRTFSAVLLPDSDLVLPEDLTGVDTWRYILDEAIGTDFGPHPDPPVEVFPGEDHLYDLVDVRDRVS